MFDNVIVGVDGRAGGEDAITLTRRLAAPGAAVTFAHVYDIPTAAGRAGALALPLELETTERLLTRDIGQAGLCAKPAAICESSVARGLHRACEERSADLLVVGSCHRQLLGRTLLGDDTSRVLDGAAWAVAIAPRGYATSAPSSLRLARIGVGCDRLPESAWALEVARSLAALHRSSIKALSTYGDRGQELAAFSAEVDLLIVGSSSYGPVGRMFAGSTSHYLARHARCPLLVLPRSAGCSGSASRLGTPVGAT